jgi:Uncharacterised nucleotidyltransferase
MWAAVDTLLERVPSLAALRFHRLALLEADRRGRAGETIPDELARDQMLAVVGELAVPAALSRIRAACDGPLVLIKGPELAGDYPAPATRPFRDLDLLTGDPRRAQRGLLAAGFVAVGDPALYKDIHHLRPLRRPGMPFVVELHSRPKWPDGLTAPRVDELIEARVPSRTGVAGIDALPPAQHAVCLAAHAWAHEPLARAGRLIDVAATVARAEPGAANALARRWGVGRLWCTTERAADALLEGDRRSAALALWARHLRRADERTVLEAHIQDLLAPLWGLGRTRAPGSALGALARDVRRDGREAWSEKLTRTRLALGHAGVAKSEHDRCLEQPVVAGTIDGRSGS